MLHANVCMTILHMYSNNIVFMLMHVYEYKLKIIHVHIVLTDVQYAYRISYSGYFSKSNIFVFMVDRRTRNFLPMKALLLHIVLW